MVICLKTVDLPDSPVPNRRREGGEAMLTRREKAETQKHNRQTKEQKLDGFGFVVFVAHDDAIKFARFIHFRQLLRGERRTTAPHWN
jgi:hypothetical protein